MTLGSGVNVMAELSQLSPTEGYERSFRTSSFS
jgi:hypothetical protein